MARKTQRPADLLAELDSVRSRRVELIHERRSVALAPMAKAEVAQRIAGILDDAEADARRAFVPEGLVRQASAGDPGVQVDGALGAVFRSSPLGALCLLGQRAAVEKVLVAEAAKISTGRSYTAAEREAEDERIADAITDAELAEEVLIRDAEAAGIEALRRKDADPAIWLLELEEV